MPLPGQQEVSFDLGEVSEMSTCILQDLQVSGAGASLCTAALALSLGRMHEQKDLDTEEAISFVQALFEWVGMYFAHGLVN